MPQAIGLAMGISPHELGLRRHIVSTTHLEVALGIPER
jgi:heterodisulfide reductase subunit B